MAYGVKPPPLAEWIVNLGEAAEYIFDHIIFQDNLVFVDFCEQLVKETNPSVMAKAEKTEAPRGDVHGYKTIADIMRSYNPFTGETYQEALLMSRIGREMICLMEGRHVHPSTIYPGGCTQPTPSCSPISSRLLRCWTSSRGHRHERRRLDFYEALPGYEEVERADPAQMLGRVQPPTHVDYTTRTWTTGATRCS
jgi:hydrogenase large subunit